MAQKFNNGFDIRDRLIAALEDENKLQQAIIKEQNTTIELLEKQISALTKQMDKIFES